MIHPAVVKERRVSALEETFCDWEQSSTGSQKIKTPRQIQQWGEC